MLTQVRLNGFRAFALESTLDFAGEAVILVGPNGSGKTSLFDGIEWGLFGKIPRLQGSRDAVGEDYVRSLFASMPTEVVLHFSRGEASAVVRRTHDDLSVIDEAGTHLSGRLATSWVRRFVMGSESDMRGEAESVFDRTVLLGQEKIVDFVRDTIPRARFDSLSTLLGADVVRRFYGKVGSWADAADQEHASANAAILQAEKGAEQLRVRRAALESEAAAGAAMSLERIQDALRVLKERGTAPPLKWPDPSGLKDVGMVVSSLQDLVRQTESQKRRIGGAIVRAEELGSAKRGIGSARERLKALAQEREVQAKQRTRALREQQKIRASLADVRASLEQVDSALAEFRSDRTRLAAFLTEARSFVLGSTCPICEQQIDHDHVLDRLEARVLELPEEETQLVQRRTDLGSTTRDVEKRLDKLTARLRQLQVADRDSAREAAETTRLVESWEGETRRLTRQWGVSNLAKVASSAKTLESTLAPVAEEIAALLSEAKAVQASISLVSITEIEAELNAQRDSHVSRRDSLGHVRQSLRSIARDAKGSEVSIVQAAIERQMPTLRAVYQRLQPHPIFDTLDVRFRTFGDRGEVYYWASLGGTSGNVAMMFSAAQLNAVAVCVFVTLNLMRPSAGLDLLLLDDPIQNMDDYNVLGLIDLLRSVRASRQVVVSTHDDQLGQLFRRKLRPRVLGQRTITHRFLSSDERGPHVVTTVDAFEEQPPVISELAG